MSQDKNEQIAIFRFGVIHEFVGGASLTAGQRRRLMREKSQTKWVIPFCARTRISKNTIYRWIRRYQNSGGKIKSLHPDPRADAGASRKLDKETIAVIINARGKQATPFTCAIADDRFKTPAAEDRSKFEAQLRW